MYATVDDLDIFFGSDEMGVFDTAKKKLFYLALAGIWIHF